MIEKASCGKNIQAKLAALVSEKAALEQAHLQVVEAVQQNESEVREAELLRVQVCGLS